MISLEKSLLKKGFTIYLKELFQFYKKGFGLFIYLREMVSNLLKKNTISDFKKNDSLFIFLRVIWLKGSMKTQFLKFNFLSFFCFILTKML